MDFRGGPQLNDLIDDVFSEKAVIASIEREQQRLWSSRHRDQQLEGQLIRRIEPLNGIPHDLARQRTMAINRCPQVRKEAVTLGDIARDCYGNRTEMMQLKTGLDHGPRLLKELCLAERSGALLSVVWAARGKRYRRICRQEYAVPSSDTDDVRHERILTSRFARPVESSPRVFRSIGQPRRAN